jgi:formyltetrahydrofolate hydrolase
LPLECHYVTSELDEGPIIEQDVLRVSHSDSVQEMQKMGQDIEKVTLAKGLQYHFMNSNFFKIYIVPTGKFFEFIMVRQNTNNLSFHF